MVGGVGCITPQETELCPAVGVGELVVTEVRGDQSGLLGQYVEIYSASASAIELRGLHVVVRGPRKPAVPAEPDARMIVGRIVVRRALTIAPGDRVVLAGLPPTSAPPEIDYAWQPDFLASGDAKNLPAADGEVELEACGDVIDHVAWTALPGEGTYSLGLAIPDAAANDDDAAWCTNATITGTPGESNPTCP